VIVGPVGSLAHLRSLGFKTFSNFWNENYDDILNPTDRIIAIVDIIQWICDKSLNDIKILCKEMSDVLNYNFDYYIKHLKNNELEKLEKFCIENLKPRYDPSDQKPNKVI
jgi:hypothetical protein